ncbi:MAG: transcription-repair coupling factor [Syntrophobacteraceae bacterium]
MKEPKEPEPSDLLRSGKSDASEILAFLKSASQSIALRGVELSALAFLLARALREVRKPFLLVAPTDREAEKMLEMVEFFSAPTKTQAPFERQLWFFPSRTGHKVQSLAKMETTARRIEALYGLRTSSTPGLVAASALGLIERLMPPDVLVKSAEYLVKGEEVDVDRLCVLLTERGFYHVSLVEEYGDFSRRGGVLDVYTPLYRWPVRMEFFGDELESIRLFHPGSQRSMGVLEEVLLLPGSEVIFDAGARHRAQQAVLEDVRAEILSPSAGNTWLDKFQEGHQFGSYEALLPVFYEKTSQLREYLDPATVVVWLDPSQIRREMEQCVWQYRKDWEESQSAHEWRRPAEELFEDASQCWQAMQVFKGVTVRGLLEEGTPGRVFEAGTEGNEALTQRVKQHPTRERLLEPVVEQFQTWRDEGIRSHLVCHHKEQARRLVELMSGYGLDVVASDVPLGFESHEALTVKVLVGNLDRGFVWPSERLAVVCEEEIFGRRTRRRTRKPTSGIFLSSFQDLHVGDFVVHVDHGIGVYKELAHLSVRGLESDFLLLEYQDGDRLYVPVDKLQKVQKYLGIEGRSPRVEKLGGKSWESSKRKAQEHAERIAEELLNLYATRQVNKGFQFTPPDKLFVEFEAGFSYEETPDQARAIEDVLADMASSRPMDRLVCGDVGYGKTEVAIRAAFKAVLDGKQVAMLVPTTVLAEQHYHTFKERFDGFPIEVASLSRFKTAAQQKQVLEKVKKGAIDVVVGTHRLLQKDVTFKDVGLLIVDEEHRFGVKDKERLKQFRTSVDVLTLTATPIPRTLQMSLAGIRDLSTIETAPQDRHAIETVVCKYDEFTIREALYRELKRGGQVFFVHNHVQSIYQMGTILTRLAPEARVAVAHGQLQERELEKIMLDFMHRKVDVLVCTTIIESGLDIPAANTIVINRADRFGLAQIYQLRGRVGRSTEQAYAYLLIPDEHLITRDAQKRLRALMDFSELGAGFKIALNDLQIRGGGTILGSAQSGHIAAIGYELYLELIERTIKRMKGEPVGRDAIDPEINVPISAFLPETFIPDADQRLLAYKRLATLSDESAIDELTSEWRDRFGTFPDSVRSLILLAKLRMLFKEKGIIRLDGDADWLVLHFAPHADVQAVLDLFEAKKCAFKVEGPRKLQVEIWGRHLAQRLLRLKRTLQELNGHVSDHAGGESGN